MMHDKFDELISVGDYCLRIDTDQIYLIYIVDLSNTGYRFIYKLPNKPIDLNSRPSIGRGTFYKTSNRFLPTKTLIKIDPSNPLFNKF